MSSLAIRNEVPTLTQLVNRTSSALDEGSALTFLFLGTSLAKATFPALVGYFKGKPLTYGLNSLLYEVCSKLCRQFIKLFINTAQCNPESKQFGAVLNFALSAFASFKLTEYTKQYFNRLKTENGDNPYTAEDAAIAIGSQMIGEKALIALATAMGTVLWGIVAVSSFHGR